MIAAQATAIADAWEGLGHGPAVPAYAAVVLQFDPLVLAPRDAEAIARRVAAEVAVYAVPSTGRVVEIPTVYDGPDLVETAGRSGMSVSELVRVHTAADFRAFFLGFIPGYAYLGGLDPRVKAPRLVSPRPRVPAGSVAVIDGQTAIYPFDSPSGWRLIGHTDERLFDPKADPPNLIRPGDLVRFRVVG